jgi:hypothetical protein
MGGRKAIRGDAGGPGRIRTSILEPIGNIPPAEAEARYHAQTDSVAMAA